jgi:hypothetical protein
MTQPEPQKEHQWLQKLVGEWTYEMECPPAPDKPPETFRGTDSVQSIGGLWVVCEGRGPGPDGGTATTMMTLGYDPAKKKVVGTFIASLMTYLWLYEGQLDAGGKKLVLDAEGPSFAGDGGTAKYQDTIEFVTDDHRTLTSHVQGPDGKWTQFMQARYRRKR